MANEIQPLNFTQNAAQKVYELIQDEGNPSLNLRVFIQGGGCSGFTYGFTFDDVINSDDMVFEKDIQSSNEARVKLLIDSLSYPYLQGAEIDYKEDIEGARFVIRNPNAKTTCGCGSSFSD